MVPEKKPERRFYFQGRQQARKLPNAGEARQRRDVWVCAQVQRRWARASEPGEELFEGKSGASIHGNASSDCVC